MAGTKSPTARAKASSCSSVMQAASTARPQFPPSATNSSRAHLLQSSGLSRPTSAVRGCSNSLTVMDSRDPASPCRPPSRVPTRLPTSMENEAREALVGITVGGRLLLVVYTLPEDQGRRPNPSVIESQPPVKPPTQPPTGMKTWGRMGTASGRFRFKIDGCGRSRTGQKAVMSRLLCP